MLIALFCFCGVIIGSWCSLADLTQSVDYFGVEQDVLLPRSVACTVVSEQSKVSECCQAHYCAISPIPFC